MVRHAAVGVFQDLGVTENRSLKSVRGWLNNPSSSESKLQQNCEKNMYNAYLTHKRKFQNVIHDSYLYQEA